MSFDINAFNQFDPSKRAYLEVVENDSGVENLQLVQKSFLQVFVMWLGRIFGFGQNRSTSMKKVAEFVAKHIETICIDPTLSKDGLDRFLSKIKKYDENHSDQIHDAVAKINEVVTKTNRIDSSLPAYEERSRLEDLDKSLNETTSGNIDQLTEEQKSSLKAFESALAEANNDEEEELNLIYQLTAENFANLLDNLDDFTSSKLYGLITKIDYDVVEDAANKNNWTIKKADQFSAVCLKRFFDALCRELVKHHNHVIKSWKLHEIMNLFMAKRNNTVVDLIDHIVKGHASKNIKIWEKICQESVFSPNSTFTRKSIVYTVVMQLVNDQLSDNSEIPLIPNSDIPIFEKAIVRRFFTFMMEGEVRGIKLQTKKNALTWLIKTDPAFRWKDQEFTYDLLQDPKIATEFYKAIKKTARVHFNKLCSEESQKAIKEYQEQEDKKALEVRLKAEIANKTDEI